MDNAIAVSFTLFGIKLAEIEGVKAGALITTSLRIYYIEFNIMREIQIFTYVHLNSMENIFANVLCQDN